MCTALSLKNKKITVFGRNLDIDVDHDWKVIITPRNFNLNFKMLKNKTNHYAFFGMGIALKNDKGNSFPLYSEAANECGLAIAGLNFPYGGEYGIENVDANHAIQLAPFELIPFILANFKDVSEFHEFSKNNEIKIVDVQFNEKLKNTTLHFIVCDKSEHSIVIEPTLSGIKIFKNPLGVLTNSPTFDFHLNNLAHYQNLTNVQQNETYWSNYKINSFAQGFGAFGLPGDNTSTSRFVKTTFLKTFSCCDEMDNDELVTHFFHILDSVQMVKGSTLILNSNHSSYDITLYSCCIDLTNSLYYFKTYYNNQINVVNLFNNELDSTSLIIYNYNKKQGFNIIS